MANTTFNLNNALDGDIVETRAGWDVKIAGYNALNKVKEDERLLGWVWHPKLQIWVIKSWTKEGKHFAHREGLDSMDLVMA